jgi:SH3-like domain-containing protein
MAIVNRAKLLSAAAMLAVLTMSGAALAAKTRCVKVPTANFRNGPSPGHDVVFTADRYFPVEVLEEKKGWVKVRDFEKEVAWVASRLLKKADTVVVRVKKGNLRSKPSVDSEVLGRVGYGEAFRVVKRKGRWLKVATPKKAIGWVRDDLTWGD